MTQQELDKLMETHPDLSGMGFYTDWKRFGYYKSKAEFEKDFKSRRQYLHDHVDEVNASLDWLRLCPRRKTINIVLCHW